MWIRFRQAPILRTALSKSKAGSVVLYDGEFYIKTSNKVREDGSFLCVDLHTGKTMHINGKQDVREIE